MQEAKMGVLDDDLVPSQDDPEELLAQPPPLVPNKEVPAPEWYRDEWIPPSVPKGPRHKPQGMRLHQPPDFSEVMLTPTQWEVEGSTQTTTLSPTPIRPTQERDHYPLPVVLQYANNQTMLHSFQEVSLSYQAFLTKAEDYYIRAFQISEKEAKDYKGRGQRPTFRKIAIHKPLPPERIHASPHSSYHHAVKLRLRELNILQHCSSCPNLTLLTCTTSWRHLSS